MDAMTLMANQFGDFSRFNGTTQNIKKKNVFCVTAFNQPYNSPLQICIAGHMHFSKKKKVSDMFFSSFFTSWTITGEKCTRAHLQENKSIYVYISISISIYIYIYISIWKPFWKRLYIYIYLIQCGVQIKLLLLLIIARLFRYSDRERVFKCGRKLKTQTTRCLKIFQRSYTN